MHNKIFVRLILGSSLILAFIACAKISTPSGGPKDRTPPVVVKSVPVNGARNFKGNKINIEFDEYVVLDNINDKFMVSPPMKRKPRVLIRGKNVDVEFDDKLKDSTTYTFYFQDAIKDLNEGNILENYKFVISTGPVIDSLSVTGNVYEASDLEVPEKTAVIMYRELADSAVEKHLPEYISRVGQDGYFRIDNIRPGTYKLYSLKDADNSKNYNLPDEEFAFLDSAINITAEKNFIPPPPVVKDTVKIKKPSAKVQQPEKKGFSRNAAEKSDTTKAKKEEPVVLKGEYQLYQFLAQKKSHYLISSHRDTRYLLDYILSLPPDTMKLDFSIPGAESNEYFIEQSKFRDTLKVWLKDSSLYSKSQISTVLKYPFTDTLGKIGYKQDTILMRFLSPRVTRNTRIKKPVFTMENNISSGFLRPGQIIVFTSKTPFIKPDTSRIRLYEVDQTTREKLAYELIRDSLNSCRYFLKSKLPAGKKFLFVADSASFGNIFNESCDSIGLRFSIKEPDTYCKLTLDIKNYDGAMIIQLLDKSEKLLAENFMKKSGKTVFALLDNGVYRVRIIYDLNGDGSWTTGDFAVHRQPEPVSYYPAELDLKAGWEIEQTWDVGVKNFKDPKLLLKKIQNRNR